MKPDPIIAVLRARRRALGLSVAETAAALGYSRRAIETWEGGQKHPGLPALRRYAELVEARLDVVGLTPLPLVGADTDELNGLRTRTHVAALTAAGHSARQIAIQVGCSARTVQRIRSKGAA